MTVVRINRFGSRYDNRVWPLDVQWSDFCAVLANGHVSVKDKTEAPMFNGVRYRSVDEVKADPSALVYDKGQGVHFVRRSKANIVEVTMLVLDYDGGLSIEEANERFRSVEYIGYTSFSHLQDKKTHKFRMVMRLAAPIPAWCKLDEYNRLVDGGEWYQILNALKKFAGPCDRASFNPNQIYYMPATQEKRMDVAQVWFNAGTPLDWSGFARKEIGESQLADAGIAKTGDIPKRSDRHLLPNQILNTCDGPIRVGDVQGKVEGVWCPFHADKRGSEFIRRVPETGNVFLYCRSCEQSFYMKRYEEVETAEPARKLQFGDFFDLSDLPKIGKFADAADFERVQKQLETIGEKIRMHRKPLAPNAVRPLQYPSHLIYLPEGAGKSRLALGLARQGEKVIFACKSWAQAFEKFESFQREGEKVGLTVRLFLSKDGKARRRFGVPVVRKKKNRPFKVGAIDEEASIQACIAANPKLNPAFIRLCWQFLSPDQMHGGFGDHPYDSNDDEEGGDDPSTARPDEEFSADDDVNVAHGANIIVTTFAQLRILKLKKQYVPTDWLIWFDDPDISDVIDIERHDSKKHGEIGARSSLEGMSKINGRWYFTRDSKQSLGWAFRKNKCVYTTTEIITKQAIERLLKKRQEYLVVHDKMEGIVGGHITVLGTDKVYKSYDGIVPLLTRRLNKEGHPVRLIADGLSQELNHSNSKGKNTLVGENILVELSVPHPAEVQTICDALGKSWQTEGQQVRREIMLDRMHQAIGRNSGYRHRGKECVILTDKKLLKWFKQETRYLIDMENSVIVDRTAAMSRRERRTQEGASELVMAIERFLNDIDGYVQDGRKVLADVDFVLGAITDPAKKTRYAARLLAALTSLSDVRFDDPKAKQVTVSAKAYHRLGKRVLERWVTPVGLDAVIVEYRAILEPETTVEPGFLR